MVGPPVQMPEHSVQLAAGPRCAQAARAASAAAQAPATSPVRIVKRGIALTDTVQRQHHVDRDARPRLRSHETQADHSALSSFLKR